MDLRYVNQENRKWFDVRGGRKKLFRKICCDILYKIMIGRCARLRTFASEKLICNLLFCALHEKTQ